MNQNERITTGIVLRTTNYKDNDKILTVFSVDEGKITVMLKSCRQLKSKLKFAGQPFCFAEWTLTQKGETCIAVNALEIESFFDITQNFDKLVYASALIEMCDYVLNPYEPTSALFVELLKSLKILAFHKCKPEIVFCKFSLKLLEIAGYKLETDKCKHCGRSFANKVVFDYNFGGFVCGLCPCSAGKEISLGALKSLKIIDNTEFDRLDSIQINVNFLKEIIAVLKENFTFRFGRKIKSLNI
ncbi:MAG: DNA repair protein RecO [Clostridia bacterium]|nr:DNA repair protein RecO [Clostridia bacterium]